MFFDVIIIGGGAAGMSAALWCAELGLSALLLESRGELGGQLLRVYNPIKNHLGVEAENGRELRDLFARQLKNFDFETRFESEASEIDFEKKLISLKSGETFSAKSIVVATGVRRRKLNVEGEEVFAGKGVLESGKRDARLAENKSAIVVGGGDAAFENALILAETARRVFLVCRGKDFRARGEFIEKVKNNGKIKILTETVLTRISGSNAVEAVELKNLKTGETEILEAQIVLARIGVEPNTEFLRGKINLDANGYVKVNSRCETSVENVFAVGDVANPISPTVSTAVGTGAAAAKAIANRVGRSEF